MSLGMRWIIAEASIEWQQRRMYFVELHSSQWLSCRILNTPALSTIVKSEYRGNQIQEDIFSGSF